MGRLLHASACVRLPLCEALPPARAKGSLSCKLTGLYRSAGNFFVWLVVVWSVSNCESGGAAVAGAAGSGC